MNDRYHVRRKSGRVFGPFETFVVTSMLRAGKLTGAEEVSTDGQTWIPIGSIADFAAELGGESSRPPPPAQAVVPPAPTPIAPPTPAPLAPPAALAPPASLAPRKPIPPPPGARPLAPPPAAADAASGQGFEFGEIDLPAPKAPVATSRPGAGPTSRPVPAVSGISSSAFGDVDLPAPKAPAVRPPPAPSGPPAARLASAPPAAPAAAASADLVDLPAPKLGPGGSGLTPPRPPAGSSPSRPAAAVPAFGEVDLGGGAGLPPPRSGPAAHGHSDLPAPKRTPGIVDLPAPKLNPGGAPHGAAMPNPGAPGSVDLPAPKRAPGVGAELPAPKSAPAGMGPGGIVDLPAPRSTATEADVPDRKYGAGGRPTQSAGVGLSFNPETPSSGSGMQIMDAPGGRPGFAVDLDSVRLDERTEPSPRSPAAPARLAPRESLTGGRVTAIRDTADAPAPEERKRPSIGLLVVLGVVVLAAGAYLGMQLGILPDLLEETSSVGAGAEADTAEMREIVFDTYPAFGRASTGALERSDIRPDDADAAAIAAWVSLHRSARFGRDSSTASGQELLTRGADSDLPEKSLAMAADKIVTGDPTAALTLLAGEDLATLPATALLIGEAQLALAAKAGPTTPVGKTALSAAETAFGSVSSVAPAASAYGVGRVHELRGDPDLATASYERALGANVRHAGARLGLARLALAASKPDVARADELLEPFGTSGVEPSTPELRTAAVLRAKVLITWGKPAEARTALEAGARAAPRDVEIVILLCGLDLDAGAIEKVRPRLDVVLPTNATNVELLLVAGRTDFAEGKFEDARTRLTKAAEIAPNDARIELWRGRTAVKLGAGKDAQGFFEHAIALDATLLAAYVELADVYLATGAGDVAMELLERAKKLAPDSPAVILAVGDVHRLRGQPAEAEAAYRSAIAKNPAAHGARLRLASLLASLKKLDEALALLDEIKAAAPSFPGLARELITLHLAKGSIDAAVTTGRAGVEADPRDLALRVIYARALIEASRFDEAIAQLKTAAETSTRNPEIYYWLGRASFAKLDVKEALRWFKQAVDLSPGSGDLHLWIGRAWAASGDNAEANAALTKAIELSPENVEAWLARAELELGRGKPRLALADLQQAYFLDSKRVALLELMADTYIELGDKKKALTFLHEAVAVTPSADSWFKIGRLQAEAGKLKDSAASLNKAVDLADTHADAWFLLGFVYRELSQRAEAKKAFEKFLKVAPPDHPDAPEARDQVFDLTGG